MLKGCFCGMVTKKKRQQNYVSCKWCSLQDKEPLKFARVTALERHQAKCKAAYLLKDAPDKTAPERSVLLQMILQQNDDIARLKARVQRLEEKRNKTPRVCSEMTPRECWAARKDTLRTVYRHFGQRKFDFWFPVDNIDVSNILPAVLFPVLEMRGEKLCLKNIVTEDVYHLGKQLWGKKSLGEINLEWYREVCEEEFGQTLDKNSFKDANDDLIRTYERFVATEKRHGSSLCPQGLVRLFRLWKRMTLCFNGFHEELWGEGVDIFTADSQQSDGSLVILEPLEPSGPSLEEFSTVRVDSTSAVLL